MNMLTLSRSVPASSLLHGLPSLLRILGAVMLALGLGACVPTWVVVDKTNASTVNEGPGGKSGFKAPEGWLQIKAPDNTALLMSKDGEGIQLIRIAQTTAARVFPQSKVVPPANVSPQDLAAGFEAELKAVLAGAEVKSKSLVPMDVGGLPGFRSHLTYRDNKGAPREIVFVGAQRGNEIFYASYSALAIHYFARDLPVFEGLVTSIRFR